MRVLCLALMLTLAAALYVAQVVNGLMIVTQVLVRSECSGKSEIYTIINRSSIAIDVPEECSGRVEILLDPLSTYGIKQIIAVSRDGSLLDITSDHYMLKYLSFYVRGDEITRVIVILDRTYRLNPVITVFRGLSDSITLTNGTVTITFPRNVIIDDVKTTFLYADVSIVSTVNTNITYTKLFTQIIRVASERHSISGLEVNFKVVQLRTFSSVLNISSDGVAYVKYITYYFVNGSHDRGLKIVFKSPIANIIGEVNTSNALLITTDKPVGYHVNDVNVSVVSTSACTHVYLSNRVNIGRAITVSPLRAREVYLVVDNEVVDRYLLDSILSNNITLTVSLKSQSEVKVVDAKGAPLESYTLYLCKNGFCREILEGSCIYPSVYNVIIDAQGSRYDLGAVDLSSADTIKAPIYKLRYSMNVSKSCLGSVVLTLKYFNFTKDVLASRGSLEDVIYVPYSAPLLDVLIRSDGQTVFRRVYDISSTDRVTLPKVVSVTFKVLDLLGEEVDADVVVNSSITCESSKRCCIPVGTASVRYQIDSAHVYYDVVSVRDDGDIVLRANVISKRSLHVITLIAVLTLSITAICLTHRLRRGRAERRGDDVLIIRCIKTR